MNESIKRNRRPARASFDIDERTSSPRTQLSRDRSTRYAFPSQSEAHTKCE
jgi:hypothetical protein